MTLPPFGLSCLIASKAALPPPSLSEAIAEAAIDGSLTVVSTRTILIPAAAAGERCLHGGDVGGCDQDRVRLGGDDRVEDRLLQGGVELLRALGVDGDAELCRLGLDAALHRDVELVASHALDELQVVVLARLLWRCNRRCKAGWCGARTAAAAAVPAVLFRLVWSSYRPPGAVPRGAARPRLRAVVRFTGIPFTCLMLRSCDGTERGAG